MIVRYDGALGTYFNIVDDVTNSTALHWLAERLVYSFS